MDLTRYDKLRSAIRRTLSPDEAAAADRALEYAAEHTASQVRHDGSPMLDHAAEVARIGLEEIGLGGDSVVAAILHDVVRTASRQDEETFLRLTDEIRDRFGKEVTLLPDGGSFFRVHVQAVVSPQFMGWVAGFGTDAKLGLHGVHEAMFIVVLSPVGSYFDNGMEPVKIIVETEDVRAVRGGTGEAKCGGNYGASNRAGERAFANGYSQVLWLDGVEHKYVEEGGGMNVVFKIGGKIVTPMLTGSILPGITRRSCLQLLRDWGTPAEERLITVDELFEAAENGTLEEAMCVGTAAVICPIGELTYGDKVYTINNFQTGPLAQKLYDTLTGIQWGTAEDPHGWTCRL